MAHGLTPCQPEAVSFAFLDARLKARRRTSPPTTPTRRTRSAGSTSPTTSRSRWPRGAGRARRRPARRGHAPARPRRARQRGARAVRRAGAQPALRPAVRLPAGRRHAQARDAAPGRGAAGGRGRRAGGRPALLRRGRAAAPPGRSAAGPDGAARRAERPARTTPPDERPARGTPGPRRTPTRGCAQRRSPAATRAAAASSPSSRRCWPATRRCRSSSSGRTPPRSSRRADRPLLLVDVRDLDDADVQAEARLPAPSRRRLCFDGLDDLDPGERARVLRVLDDRDGGMLIVAASRAAATQLGDRTTLLLEVPMPTSTSALGLAGADGRRGRERRGREVPPVDRADRRGRPGRHASPRRPRGGAPRRPSTSTSAPARHPARGSASSHRGSTRAALGGPRRARRQLEQLQSISSYLRHRDLVLHGMGLRADRQRSPRASRRCSPVSRAPARRWPRRCSRNELGLELYRVDLATIVSQVHRGDGEEPRPDLRRRRGVQRDPVLRRGRRAVRQAHRGLGLARPLRQHRGRLPAAEDGGLRGRGHPGDQLPSNIDDAFLRRLDFVIDFPFPDAEDRLRIWDSCCRPRRRSPRTSTSTSSPSASSSPAARSATARSRRVPAPPTTPTRSRCATSCARSRWSTASSAGSRWRRTSSSSTRCSSPVGNGTMAPRVRQRRPGEREEERAREEGEEKRDDVPAPIDVETINALREADPHTRKFSLLRIQRLHGNATVQRLMRELESHRRDARRPHPAARRARGGARAVRRDGASPCSTAR